jgi:hypothetical protein
MTEYREVVEKKAGIKSKQVLHFWTHCMKMLRHDYA